MENQVQDGFHPKEVTQLPSQPHLDIRVDLIHLL